MRNRTYTYVPVTVPTRRVRRFPWKTLVFLALWVLAIVYLSILGALIMGIVTIYLTAPRCPRHTARCRCRNKVDGITWRKQRKAQRQAERNHNPNHPYS